MRLIASDGVEFEVDSHVAAQSTLLQQYPENFTDPIPLPNVKGSVLKFVVDFWNRHKDDPPYQPEEKDDDDPNRDIYEPTLSDDISEWDKNFINQFNLADGTLFDIIMAANYLGVKSLVAVGCKAIANLVRGKSSAEVRNMFNIDYKPPSAAEDHHQ